MRSQTGLVVVAVASSVVMCLTGCATPHVTAPAASSASAAAPASCKDGTVLLRYDPSVAFQATGDRGAAFRIVNRGSSACHLMGYPKVTLKGRLGALVPFHYTDGQSQYVTGRPPQPVTVQPGGWAYVAVAKYRCDLGNQASATTITMLLPGQHNVVAAALTGAQNLDYCVGGSADPGNTVAVSPVEPTADRLQN